MRNASPVDHRPEVLRAETDRLLDLPASRRFIDAFLDYWLDLRKILATAPDGNLYPDYYLDDLLTESALEETRLFFAELLRAVPNVSFSKSNFSMYNFSIRGIGTKAVSASSDPAVAVSFNNTPLIRNRLFEQEYLDVARVEVLRGPQGTLYGKNTTAGAINVTTNQPTFHFEGRAELSFGNLDFKQGKAAVSEIGRAHV